MGRRVFLGVDTSCYTTSLAVVDQSGTLLQELRKPLPVAAGEVGLRQSDGVFHHVRNLPQLIQSLEIGVCEVQAVGVSDRPRPVSGSYMPVFLAGVAVAQALATSSAAPLYRFSHQEGHIAAGLGGRPVQHPLLVLHISGGTSELLRVQPAAAGFAIDVLGGSADLSAGQMVDRVGVALGLPFPAGPDLERLARGAQGAIRLPSAAAGLSFSFSGPCSAALRLVEAGETPAEIAFAVFRVIANSLEKVLRRAGEAERLDRALLVGGVMNNQLVRDRLLQRLGPRFRLDFAAAGLSSDNAAGIAWLARERYLQERLSVDER